MSGKTSTQPGRRTPLSLSGAVAKPNPNKIGGNATNGGNNANGHNTTNTNKQDNKLQQQQKTEQQLTVNNLDTKDNLNKKQQQQQQADKKQQQDINKKSNEKNQNGANSNKQGNENKQQQQKEKLQNQNGDDNKFTEKDKKEKSEKSEKSDKLEKKLEILQKEESKVKEDKKQEAEKDSKKEEKKTKEPNDVREDKKEVATKNEGKVEQQQQVKNEEKKSKEENHNRNGEQKPDAKIENMEVAEEQPQIPLQHKSSPVAPKSNTKANKSSTPALKTPTKANEKIPQKSSPVVKNPPITKRAVTTVIDDNDDIEMEPLTIESSPIKSSQSEKVAHVDIIPSATSTPGKTHLPKRNTATPKSDVQLAIQSGMSLERPRVFSQISGRKSIRPISDYTPSKFQSNSQFRESYRRINTELDVTNSSMNVTVGSEVPNNLSFSFFGRGRKRDHTPPTHSQSAIGELPTENEISPPKKARLDMQSFFNVVSSPLSLLRNRFSKTTLQSSTPVKLQEKLDAEDETEVQNVSGVSVHEEIANTDKESIETNKSTNAESDAKETEMKIESAIISGVGSENKEFTDVSLKYETCGMELASEELDIKITETSLQPAVGDTVVKNKKCIVM